MKKITGFLLLCIATFISCQRQFLEIDTLGNESALSFNALLVNNIILNPGFENPDISMWAADMAVKDSSNNKYSGKMCMKLQQGGSVTQVISGLKPNTTYRLSAYMKVAREYEVVYLGVKQFAGYNKQVSRRVDMPSYQLSAVEFTTGPNSTQATVFAWADDEYCERGAYVDEFLLEELLVGNAGFESSSLLPWIIYNTAQKVSGNNAYKDSFSLKLPKQDCSVTQNISGLKPNTTYKLSAWLKVATNGQYVYLGAKNFGGAQAAVSVSQKSYQQRTVYFTTGAGNTSANVFIWTDEECANGAFADDVRLEEVITGLKNIWAVDDGEKIRQEHQNNPLSLDPQNKVWQNGKVNLFGAKNEIISFQLIMEANNTDVTGADVRISDLKKGPSTINGFRRDSIPSPANMHTELFKVHYLHVPTPSSPDYYYKTGANIPHYTGYIPDALLPFSPGESITIPANKTQAVWADIYIPKSTASGNYTGNITVTYSGQTVNIPIQLKVYNFTLPDSNQLMNMFGFFPNEIENRYTKPRYREIAAKYFQMAHRHKMDLCGYVYSLTEMNQFDKGYLNGSMYSNAAGYYGPGAGIGNRTFSIGHAGSLPWEYGDTNTDSLKWRNGTIQWANWFATNAPNVQIFKYADPDEPKSTADYNKIKQQYAWTPNKADGSKRIPLFVAEQITTPLINHVNFWSALAMIAADSQNAAMVNTEKAKGNFYGIYNGFAPATGTNLIDFPATDFRVIPWIYEKYQLNQYFYWGVNVWRNIDPFTDPYTFKEGGLNVAGDGTLFYPGPNGPVSSIRMKNWRRGVQDYQYIQLLKAKGVSTANFVNGCVPSALWDAKNAVSNSWPERGHKFESFRLLMANAIVNTP
ncbi:MAG TPA: DUF6067 family protein [Niabella sp.]|nr:DUF6067 family protein [Niabella sp.]